MLRWRNLPGYVRWRFRLYGFYWPDGRFHWQRLFTRRFFRSIRIYYAWLSETWRSCGMLTCPRCDEQCVLSGGEALTRCPTCGTPYDWRTPL